MPESRLSTRKSKSIAAVLGSAVLLLFFENCTGYGALVHGPASTADLSSVGVNGTSGTSANDSSPLITSADTTTTDGTTVTSTGPAVGQSFEILSTGTMTPVTIQYPSAPADRFRGIEAPPWVFKGGDFGYAITTAESSNCWSPYSLTTSSSLSVSCADVNTSSILTERARGGPDSQERPWVRNYNGIMSLFPYADASKGNILLTVHHGENLNEIREFSNTSVTMQNSITQIDSELVANCWANYSGVSSASPLNCYWGFVSLGWMPYSAASGWGSLGEPTSIGPVTWPVDGYINADGTQSSRGVRHPTGFVDNGFLYIYYLDASLNADRGIRVVRAPVATALNATTWQRLQHGRFVTGTLPAGFQIASNQIDSSFYKMKSPPMDFAFAVPSTERPDRFAVAKMTTGGYIGVEVGLDANGLGELGVRTSSDLINWSARQLIPLPGYNQGGSSPVAPAYALLLSADGTSNTLIDPNNFYIYGTIAGYQSVLRIPMHVVGGPLPSPAIRYGAVNAGDPLSCDELNPDAIKNLSTDAITWLASLQTSGLTLHENYLVARSQGYTGAFGAGEHAAWLAQDPARQTAFNNAITAFANTATPPWATWVQHNQARRAAGYQGLFICGGDACYQAGQCDNLGRRL